MDEVLWESRLGALYSFWLALSERLDEEGDGRSDLWVSVSLLVLGEFDIELGWCRNLLSLRSRRDEVEVEVEVGDADIDTSGKSA